MALPYFYEAGVTGEGIFTLSEDTSKHCVQVLRMKAGEQLNLADGKGKLYTTSIVFASKNATQVLIENVSHEPRTPGKTCIAISLLKNNSRLEWFLEKATEIGVHEIFPLICERTERQHFRYERMNSILVAAMLQSQQTWLPELHEPVSFKEVLTQVHQQKFIAHCIEAGKKELKDFTIGNDILMLIGPEGDFTPGEIEVALQHGFEPVSLGATRLRSETAGVVAATLLMNL